jgi:ribosomal protein L32
LTGHSLYGRTANNPNCHSRAIELEKRGLRERVVKVRDAPKQPFAIGEFELVLEPIPGREAHERFSPTHTGPALVQLKAAQETSGNIPEGRIAPQLELCRACQQYIYPHEVTCPHCGADVAEAASEYEADARRRRELIASMNELIRKREERMAHAQ